MGLSMSSTKKASKKRQKRILMVGLPNAGKTTVLSQLFSGDITTTTPAPGFQVETLEDKNFHFTVWDFGCGKGIETIRKKYFKNIEGVIFVVDSCDYDKFCEALFFLHHMLQDEKLKSAALLVYANKQDIANAMDVTDITEELLLEQITNRRWGIVPTNATRGVGLNEGLEWLACEIA